MAGMGRGLRCMGKQEETMNEIEFKRVAEGERFIYDHTRFEKTAPGIAWEIKYGEFWKEWAFMPEDKVILV
jgi:hypothetical protein